MLRRSNSINRKFHRGQTFVEMAIVSPLLLLLLLVVADFGRLFFFGMAVRNAARAGAVYGSQASANSTDTSGMKTAALNEGSNVAGMTASASTYCQCPGNSSTFTCPSVSSCTDQRTYVKVQTSASFHTLVTYPGIPSTVSLQSTAVMRAQ